MKARVATAVRWIVLFSLLTTAGILSGYVGKQPATASAAALPESPVSAPVMFIENVGQFDAGARFAVLGAAHSVWLTEDVIWITIQAPVDSFIEKFSSSTTAGGTAAAFERLSTSRKSAHIKLIFEGANPDAKLEAFSRQATHVSYFLGSNPDKWYSDVPVWGGVRYVDLYPGVDLVIGESAGDPSLPWHLEALPEADLSAVRLRVDGADSIVSPSFATDQGANYVRLTTAAGDLILPLLNVVDKQGFSVALRTGNPEVKGCEIIAPFSSSHVAASLHSFVADHTSDLVYSTFLGGSFFDSGLSIAVDQAGSAYATGVTASNDLPSTPGVSDPSHNGGLDAYVVKLNEAGTGLADATFLGGASNDWAWSIAIDAQGNRYVTGDTLSSDFPTTPGAFDRSYASQSADLDLFVAKLNPTGTQLLYSTYLGGWREEARSHIVVDNEGNAYLTGRTRSPDFPTTPGSYSQTYNYWNYDVFVVKLNAAGSDLIFSTLVGGGSWDHGMALAIDGAGSVYVAGRTDSSDFPTTGGALRPWHSGGWDEAFVLKLSATGSQLLYSTFLGGTGGDLAEAIAVDTDGDVFVSGYTDSADFPTTMGAYDTSHNGSSDAFVAKLSADGSNLLYSTFLGGAGPDSGWGIAVDAEGSAFLTGVTNSSDFPTTAGAFDTSHNGGYDAFVAKLSASGTDLAYSTYLGGSGTDYGWSCALASGSVFVTGDTFSSDFPVTAGAFDRSHNGDSDAFVAKLTIGGVNQCPTVDAGGPYCVDEGGATTVIATGSDPDGDLLTYAWDLDNDGTFETPGQSATFSAADLDGPATHTVAVQVSDTGTPLLTATDEATIEILNVAPTPAIAGAPASIPEGTAISLSCSATDPSPADVAAGFTFEWTVTKDGAPFATGSGSAFTFTPDDNATYEVTLSATDKDGGTGTAGVHVTVQNVCPAITALVVPSEPTQVNMTIQTRVDFTDVGSGDTHAVVWDWDDGSTSSGAVVEVSGSGYADGSHSYATPGVYTVKVTVADDDNCSVSTEFQYIVIYDPAGGFVTGGGWINSPAGAYTPDPSLTGKATFGFVSKYKKGATIPTGNTEFQFKAGNLNFHSESYEWLVVAGPKAQFKGIGTINGDGAYRFFLTAIDGQVNGGGGVDKFRIRIWDDQGGALVYDNQLGAPDDADPTTAIAGGSIVIHKE